MRYINTFTYTYKNYVFLIVLQIPYPTSNKFRSISQTEHTWNLLEFHFFTRTQDISFFRRCFTVQFGRDGAAVESGVKCTAEIGKNRIFFSPFFCQIFFFVFENVAVCWCPATIFAKPGVHRLLYNELYLFLAFLMPLLFCTDNLMAFFASRYEGQYGMSATWSGRPQLTHFVAPIKSSSFSCSRISCILSPMSNVNWGAQDASKFYICGIWEMALDLISDGGYFDIRRKARHEE